MYCKTRFLVIKLPIKITYRLVYRISASFSEISPICLPLSKLRQIYGGQLHVTTQREGLSRGFIDHIRTAVNKRRILLTSTSYVEFTAFTCIKSKISVNGLRRNLKDFFKLYLHNFTCLFYVQNLFIRKILCWVYNYT